MSETQMALSVLLLLLAPLAGAGLSLMNAGLGRSRNAAHSIMAALCVIGVSACVWFVCGAAFEGSAGGPAYFFNAGGKPWDWIGAGHLFRLVCR